MSKFPPPKFFATDKDVHDLLAKLNTDALVAIGKARGLLVSHSSAKDLLVGYLSRQNFSFYQLQHALRFLERDEKEEKATPSKLDADVDLAKVTEAFEQVRDARSDPDERMQVTAKPTGELEVKIAYTHLDYSQATLRQRTTKEITFLVQKNGSVLDFSYNNNAKAAGIYGEVKAILKGEEPCKITESVSLNGVKTVADRIKFFLTLMNGVTGFRLRSVANVKAERMANAEPAEGQDERAKEQLENMVKKMALAGGSVWTSPEFASMVTGGFFVYSARWLGTELQGENRTIGFDAGFSDGECLDFAIRVLGVYKRNQEGNLEKKLTTLPADEREALRRIVHNSAFEAVERLQPKVPDNRAATETVS